MDIEQVKNIVQNQLSEERYAHTLRVTEVALELADIYRASKEKVQYAAMFHDYLKEIPINELKKMIQTCHGSTDVLEYHPALWHGPAAAIHIHEEFKMTDSSILRAIKYHTTGRSNMDLVEQIVFIADYIEPARSFPNIDKIRKAALTNIEEAIRMALANMIIYLIHQGALIYPKTMEAYNAYTRKLLS